MILRLCHHDGIHQNAGDLHQAGVQRTELHHLFYLHNDFAAGILGGLGKGQGIQGHTLMLHGAVAPLVGVSSTDHCHIQGDGMIKQLFFPAEVDHFHHIAGLFRLLVDLAAL